MQTMSPIILDEILGDVEYPSFKQFRSCVNGSHKLFSIADGVIILESYIVGKEADLSEGDINADRISRAENQSKRMKLRDNSGLLGKTVHRIKDPNMKHPKTVRSVWTVKKK